MPTRKASSPTRNASTLPIPVLRSLRKLGQDIRDARRRRRIPAAILAARASISRTTLNKIEAGDEGVYIGNYAAVLFALGLADRIANLADVTEDPVGRELDEERLPQRIRLSRLRSEVPSPRARKGAGSKAPKHGNR